MSEEEIEEILNTLKNPEDNLRCTLGYAKQYCIGRKEIQAIQRFIRFIQKRKRKE